MRSPERGAASERKKSASARASWTGSLAFVSGRAKWYAPVLIPTDLAPATCASYFGSTKV
jgi:hypothetical protein